MKFLVVIPTYNERENIPHIITEIFKENSDVHVLVVDDNSPDGTARIVESMQPKNPQIHLLNRKQKQGLGPAYIAGFQWGLQSGYDVIVEMDADFSHRPVDLKKIIAHFRPESPTQNKYDFVVGSRYVPGGQVVNWGWMRLFISKGGGLYSRFILGYPLRDWTGGFNAWKASVLQGIDLSLVRSNGYSFQIELKYRALRKNFKGYEQPIVFEDRRVGQSKMSLKIVIEAFYRVWLLRF